MARLQRWLTGIVVVIILGGLSACAAPTDTPEMVATRYFAADGTNDYRHEFPLNIDCTLLSSLSSGPSWHGLTVGVSTIIDVEKSMGLPVRAFPEGGFVMFGSQTGDPDLSSIEMCFLNDTLGMIDLNMRSFDDPDAFANLLGTYLVPDRVTWSPVDVQRSLIWAEQGRMAVVQNFEDTVGVVNIILFPPIPAGELDSSWLISALPDHQPWSGDSMGSHSWEGTPDPWGIEKKQAPAGE